MEIMVTFNSLFVRPFSEFSACVCSKCSCAQNNLAQFSLLRIVLMEMSQL